MPTYSHMCRMDHEEIGFDTDSERCPLCLQMDGNDTLNRENAELKARVAELEEENARLKAKMHERPAFQAGNPFDK